jgi:polar amino acid transport system substrate-binding protein
MRVKRIVHFLIYCVLLAGASASSAELNAVTGDDNYPYNFIADGEVRGLGYDLVLELARRSGNELKLRVMPWPRALQTARLEPGVMIFTLGKTEERNAWYHWIGPIVARDIWLYKLADQPGVVVNRLSDAKKYRVGDTRGDATIPALLSIGIEPDLALTDVDSCRKLKAGRIDLVPLDPIGISYFARSCGIPVEKMERTVQLVFGEYYFIGIGKTTDPALVSSLNAAFDGMRRDRSLQKIIDRWTPKTEGKPKK